MLSAESPVVVDGLELVLTHLAKVLYPEALFTKADAIDYVVRIAPALLPHLRGRPLTLKRFPDGVEAGAFYEKNCPSPRPDWVRTTRVAGGRRGNIDFCVVDDLPTLVWVLNLASLELHTSLSLAGAPHTPTALVFDLDPGPPAGVVDCARVALLLRTLLEREGLTAFVKTSGAKGLQLYVPLNDPAVTYDDTKEFARAAAVALERHHGDLVVSRVSKAEREGRVLVDWAQNDAHRTMVSAYSLRGATQPTVSTPVTWDEVAAAVHHPSPGALVFEWSDALARVERLGDLFAPVLTMRQRLPTLV